MEAEDFNEIYDLRRDLTRILNWPRPIRIMELCDYFDGRIRDIRHQRGMARLEHLQRSRYEQYVQAADFLRGTSRKLFNLNDQEKALVTDIREVLEAQRAELKKEQDQMGLDFDM